MGHHSERAEGQAERDPSADQFFIEEMAMLLEQHSHFPPIAGRIYALLLITEESCLSQADIVQALGASAASVSTMVNRLLDEGRIERVAVPGSRRANYRLRVDSWNDVATRTIRVARRFAEQADKGLALPGPDISPSRHRLREMRDLYNRVGDVLEDSIRA
jgi:DNA-binding MarR family transcriptional regulator